MSILVVLTISIIICVTNMASAFVVPNKAAVSTSFSSSSINLNKQLSRLSSAASAAAAEASTINEDDKLVKEEEIDEEKDFTEPEDAIINIHSRAMKHLRFLKEQQKLSSLILRMGVRNGGCSGLSYVMDYTTEDKISVEEDIVDVYPDDNIKCVIDSKSMLYLYGLKLDYSDDLIGGGFKFSNPNAESSCGCGSSFGV